MSGREPILPSSRGLRAALLSRRGPAAAALALGALLFTRPALAQDPCLLPHGGQPGTSVPARVLSERVRCLEAQGRLEEVVPLLQRLAQAPEAAVRERAYLHLYRLGQEVALPQAGEAGELAPAPGCSRGLWADRYAWAAAGSEGTGALLFTLVPDIEAEGPADEATDGATPAAPVEPSRPEDAASELGGALDLLVSSVQVREEAAVRAEDLQCTVVAADACSGRVGVVCEDRSGLPAPEEDQQLPFPLPPEHLEVKEFLLP
jgi:hypothetical protein